MRFWRQYAPPDRRDADVEAESKGSILGLHVCSHANRMRIVAIRGESRCYNKVVTFG